MIVFSIIFLVKFESWWNSLVPFLKGMIIGQQSSFLHTSWLWLPYHQRCIIVCLPSLCKGRCYVILKFYFAMLRTKNKVSKQDFELNRNLILKLRCWGFLELKIAVNGEKVIFVLCTSGNKMTGLRSVLNLTLKFSCEPFFIRKMALRRLKCHLRGKTKTPVKLLRSNLDSMYKHLFWFCVT